MKDKEHFSDSAHDLLKSLVHLSIAKLYFKMLKIGKKELLKNLFNQFIQRCEWIERNIYDRMDEVSRKQFKEYQLEGDNMFYDELSSKLLLLNEKQKPLVEDFVNGLIDENTPTND